MPLVAALIASAAAGAGPASAQDFTAFFPARRPAVQVDRHVTLQQAAQAGLIKLESKGGGEGDAVSLELDGNKRIRGDVTITLRVEITVPPRLTAENRAIVRDLILQLEQSTEAELNHIAYRTKDGDAVRFKLDWEFREPEKLPDPSYNQVTLIDPAMDSPNGDPTYRSRVFGRGIPNAVDETRMGFWSTTDPSAKTLAHESMHLMGLPDHYGDVYRIGNRDYPLPKRGMSPEEVRAWARAHHPRLPGPPAGNVASKNLKGYDACDFMGTNTTSECRRISQGDIDWFASQAGIEVAAEPGDLLLNKDPARQNFGVSFNTVVFATPGSTTVANGIAVYCLDHDRSFPFGGGFDVGPKGVELPGYEGVVKLLQLNAKLQTTLNDSLPGMQAAIWNLTDGSPLETSGTATESRTLMAQAGVSENSVPGGLPALADPNAGSPDTGAVDAASTVLTPVETSLAKAPLSVFLSSAQLFPNRFSARSALFADLVVTAQGDVKQVGLRIERRVRRRWRAIRTLRSRVLTDDSGALSVSLGRLGAGSYRLVISAPSTQGASAVLRVPFAVLP